MSKDAEDRDSESPAILSEWKGNVVVFLVVVLDGLESRAQAGSRGSLLAQTQTQNPDPREPQGPVTDVGELSVYEPLPLGYSMLDSVPHHPDACTADSSDDRSHPRCDPLC